LKKFIYEHVSQRGTDGEHVTGIFKGRHHTQWTNDKQNEPLMMSQLVCLMWFCYKWHCASGVWIFLVSRMSLHVACGDYRDEECENILFVATLLSKQGRITCHNE